MADNGQSQILALIIFFLVMLPLCWTAGPFSPSYSPDERTQQCACCARLWIKDDNDEDRNIDVIKCPQNCGAVYCNQACQSRHEDMSQHCRLLCVGPVDESHPLYQYKILVLTEVSESGRTDVYNTLMLALELVVVHFQKWRDEMKIKMTKKIQQEQEQIADDLFDEDLLKRALELVNSIITSSGNIREGNRRSQISFVEWVSVLNYCHQNQIQPLLSSPWALQCKQVTATDGWESDQQQTKTNILLQEARTRWAEDLLQDESGTDENEQQDDEAVAEIDAVQLMDEPDYYFPPTPVALLLDIGNHAQWKHSCFPTHEVTTVEGSGLQQVEIVPLPTEKGGLASNSESENGENRNKPQPTISIVDTNPSLEERTEELRYHGIQACHCARCRFEQDPEEFHDSISYECLKRLLELAKSQQRHDDSLDLCRKLLQRDESDASVLLDQARIVGWTGSFAQRESMLEEAAKMVSKDDNDGAKIHTALAEAKAYFRNDWDALCNIASTHHYEAIDGLDGQAFISEGLLDSNECLAMIEHAERYQEQLGGWTTSRHYAVPTTDVAVYKMPEVLNWFNLQLEHKIYPLLGQQFECSNGRLRMFDAFFVKYDATSGQKRLPLHNDQSTYSLTIAMNDMDNYEGGGTYFAETGQSYRTKMGGVISFDGQLLHAGKNITSGTRYIIACFLYVEER